MACAAWALGESEVDLVDASVPWAGLRRAEETTVVLHDALCPMTPPDFIACLPRARALRPATASWACRPVTDTVKVVADGFVGETVDREGLLAIASPLVLPAVVVAAVHRAPVTDLAPSRRRPWRSRSPRVDGRRAPPEAGGCPRAEDVALLEALTDLG